jgi:hypothetical protein
MTIPSANELLQSARAHTGLHDCGDARFLTALDQLLRSINAEATLPETGQRAATLRYTRLLVNRLRFQADLLHHPEILDEKLPPPLIILGLPRVGSTKLHQLMAKTGDFQALLFWQGFNPARYAELQTREENLRQEDARIAEAIRFLEWRSRRNPATDAAHYLAATEPEEDTYLLEFSLHTYWPFSYYEVPSFLRWLAPQDRTHAFQYVKMLLQYLQWQFPGAQAQPWVLKSPPNLGFEAEMAQQFPGARFVMLHRDPTQVIPSLVAIVREIRRLYGEGAGDLKKVGVWALEEYSTSMTRHLRWRDTVPANSVLDIAYTDIRDDYVSVARRVYDFCGFELSTSALERMSTWAGDNEQHKHGIHQYSIEESGLSNDLINERFSEYLRGFGTLIRE